MRTGFRLAFAAAAGTAVLAVAVPQPAYAAEVQVSLEPQIVAPGHQVTIYSNCGTTTAIATSQVFKTQPLLPSAEGGESATVTIPKFVQPGVYEVVVQCGNGNSGKTVLRVGVAPTKGPKTGGGSTAAGLRPGPLMVAGAALGGFVLLIALVAVRRRHDHGLDA